VVVLADIAVAVHIDFAFAVSADLVEVHALDVDKFG
jgi:hypothetical protein